jgi:hypothetical protein
MYQVIEGCHYEGPYSGGKFYYKIDNSVERALLIMELDNDMPEYCWTEITDEKTLKGWGCVKLWFKLSMDEDRIKDTHEDRSYGYTVIYEVKVEDSKKVDSGIMVYTKEEN